MIVGNRANAHHIYLERSKKSISYAVRQIKESVLAPYIKKLYIYGSCARGEQRYDSDVDLFMELSDEIDLTKYKNDVLFLKTKVSPLDYSLPEVDLKVVVGKAWMKNNMLYYKNVRKEGSNIWEAE